MESTWKWIVGLLLTLLLSVLSYSAVQLEDRVHATETKASIAEHKADLVESRYQEILRRLDRLEQLNDRILERVSPQAFPTGRKPPVEFGR